MGRNHSPSLTSKSVSAQEDWVPSQMLLPIAQMSTRDPEQTPHPPTSVHYSYHNSWTPPHSVLVSWMTLLEDSRKHLISSESGQTSPSTSQVTHSPRQ